LHIDRVNQNQGAESTLAFLLSLAEMHRAQNTLAALDQQATIAS
jgi:phage protein D